MSAAYVDRVGLESYGVPRSYLEALSDVELSRRVQARSAFADGYLRRSGVKLPLASWGDDLRLAVAQLVAWDIIAATYGANPNEGENPWLERRNEALRWLEGVGRGDVVPLGLVSTEEAETSPGIEIASELPWWTR